MMKKTIQKTTGKALLFILVLSMLSGCSLSMPGKTEPAASAAPTVEPVIPNGIYTFNKHKANPSVIKNLNLNENMFNNLYDAVDVYAQKISAVGHGLTQIEYNYYTSALKTKFELQYLDKITLSDDGQYITFTYNMDQAAAQNFKNKFIRRVEDILICSVKPDFSTFEKVLSLYQYVQNNIALAETGNAYNAITEGRADSMGIAQGFQYILDQVGIENHLATTGYRTWNVINVDGSYYHFDPILEDSNLSLLYFGMTDTERVYNYSGWSWTDACSFTETGETCDNEKYNFLRGITYYGMDYTSKTMYFVKQQDGGLITKCNYENGEQTVLYNKKAAAMVYHGGYIYYSDLDNRNQLYRMKPETGEAELLDSVFVTRMMLKGNVLIYIDDVSNQEKSMPLQ